MFRRLPEQSVDTRPPRFIRFERLKDSEGIDNWTRFVRHTRLVRDSQIVFWWENGQQHSSNVRQVSGG